MTPPLFGAAIRRNEDPRLLRGRGCFVADGTPASYRLRPDALTAPALPRYGPYNVEFIRDEQLPGFDESQRRKDITMDATNGAVEVNADLLRKIRITHSPQPHLDARVCQSYVP